MADVVTSSQEEKFEEEKKIESKTESFSQGSENKFEQKINNETTDVSNSLHFPTEPTTTSTPEELLEIKHAARMIYEKVYDESVGRYYYFNARDQSSSWELPPEFNGDDTFLLTPRSRELMVLKMDEGTWKTSKNMTKDQAARTIQGMFRRRQARKIIVQAIQSMYEKVYDEQSGMFFYFNKVTQQSIWTKPALLGYWNDVELTPRSKQMADSGQVPGYSQAYPVATGPEADVGGKVSTVPEVDELYSNLSSQQSQLEQQQQQMNYSISSDEGSGDEYKSNATFSESKISSEFKMDGDMLLRQLQDFLSDNGLEDYEEALIEDGFDDMEALLAILEEDIDSIGFTIADKRILMNAIDKFRATADLEYDVSESESDDEKRDNDEISGSEGSDVDHAEDKLRRQREEGDEYSISDGGYPDGEVNLDGVDIKIVFEGDNENFPEPGQIVRMHYKAFIQGSQNSFEDSRLRGRVFEFKLDAAQVVPGLDEAMRTLSWGTKAQITLEPRVAYGESGHPPVIPPNATIVFEVQFIKSYFAERNIDLKEIE